MWLPRTGSLCRLLALMVGLLVVFHAASCGYFFCFRFPVSIGHDAYDNIRDLFSLAGGPKVCSPSLLLYTPLWWEPQAKHGHQHSCCGDCHNGLQT